MRDTVQILNTQQPNIDPHRFHIESLVKNFTEGLK